MKSVDGKEWVRKQTEIAYKERDAAYSVYLKLRQTVDDLNGQVIRVFDDTLCPKCTADDWKPQWAGSIRVCEACGHRQWHLRCWSLDRWQDHPPELDAGNGKTLRPFEHPNYIAHGRFVAIKEELYRGSKKA